MAGGPASRRSNPWARAVGRAHGVHVARPRRREWRIQAMLQPAIGPISTAPKGANSQNAVGRFTGARSWSGMVGSANGLIWRLRASDGRMRRRRAGPGGRRPLGVRLRLADVAAGVRLSRPAGGAAPWPASGFLHLFGSPPRHLSASRPGAGPGAPAVPVRGRRLSGGSRRHWPETYAYLREREQPTETYFESTAPRCSLAGGERRRRRWSSCPISTISAMGGRPRRWTPRPGWLIAGANRAVRAATSTICATWSCTCARRASVDRTAWSGC